MSSGRVNLQNNQDNTPACTVMFWRHFVEYPPLLNDCFSRYYDPKRVDHRVLDLSGMREKRNICEMKVSSPDDLLRLIQDLFGRLILFRATLCHVKETQVQRNNTHVDRWKDDFAVLLNLQHDELQGAMKEKLDKAMDCMVKGKKFCLQLSFDHKLLEWYSERVDGKRSDMEYIYGVSRYHYAKNISLIVHNCSTQVDCCLSWWTICLCFPFWALLGGPCYCLYRKALVTEMEEKVDVSIKFRMTDTPLPKCTKGGRCGLQLIQHMQTTGMSTRGLVDKFKCMDLVTYH